MGLVLCRGWLGIVLVCGGIETSNILICSTIPVRSGFIFSEVNCSARPTHDYA